MPRRNLDDALWTFRTAHFTIAFYAEPEELDPADSFEFPDDIEFARSGDPAHWFCAVVEITENATGLVVARDTLGGCSYNSFREFYTAHRTAAEDDRNTLALKAQNRAIVHYFPDMVRQAVDEARRTAAMLKQPVDAVHA